MKLSGLTIDHYALAITGQGRESTYAYACRLMGNGQWLIAVLLTSEKRNYKRVYRVRIRIQEASIVMLINLSTVLNLLPGTNTVSPGIRKMS